MKTIHVLSILFFIGMCFCGVVAADDGIDTSDVTVTIQNLFPILNLIPLTIAALFVLGIVTGRVEVNPATITMFAVGVGGSMIFIYILIVVLGTMDGSGAI